MDHKRGTGVVLIVLDGLRPDLVTADVMPALTAFRARGTEFAHARSVFPSVTPVAAASLATGACPCGHGIPGNELFVDGLAGIQGGGRVLDLGDVRIVRALEQTLPGGLLTAPTFADVLSAAGRRLAIVDAGAPVASTMLDPKARRNGHWTFSTSGRDASPTPNAWDETIARFGFPPERELPRFEEITYATDVFIDHVLDRLVPDVAVLWLCEPDATSRYRGIGSIEAENAVRHADRQLGRIFEFLDRKSRGGPALVVVASDHGQITVTRNLDVLGKMREAGLPAVGRHDAGAGSLVLIGRGYGALVAPSEEPRLVERAADWLIRQPCIGNVFMSGGNDLAGAVRGTLSLAVGGLGGPRAPAIYFTLRGETGLDRHGIPGRGWRIDDGILNAGTHGGLDVVEMATVLMIQGPGFEPGRISGAAAGLLDLAPTILARFALPVPARTTGRNLAAADREPRRLIRLEARNESFAQSVVVARTGSPEGTGAMADRLVEAGAINRAATDNLQVDSIYH
jgi:hypothetical protein